jgi:hypothetical protein
MLRKTAVLGLAGLILFLFAPPCSGALDISVSRAELEAAFIPKFDKNFYYSWGAAAAGLLELNECLTFSSGLTLNRVRDETETGAFMAAEYGLPFFRTFVPLYLKGTYIFNNLFGASTHTLFPSAGLHWRWFGFDVGPALRYTLFNQGEDALYEPVFGYSVYVCAYNTETARIALRLANIGDFEVRNIGAYSLYLDNRFRINEWISLRCELEAAISGNVGHLTSVYGLTFREGVIFTW